MTESVKLSAAIITLNEENNIEACLQSLSWVDEIVVVDSMSQDRTCELAENFGARVIKQPFLGHVKQKQLAVDACTNDWVLAVDADERVTEGLQQAILKLIHETPEIHRLNGYTVARKSFHLGRWILHGSWYPDRKIRFFNRKYGHWGGVDPHDRIEIEGPEGHLNGELEHYVFRDLSHNVKQNDFFSSISARILFEKGERPSLLKLLLKPPGKFIETYIVKGGFLDGLPGFIIAVGAAYSIFLKYAKLWEHHLRKQ